MHSYTAQVLAKSCKLIPVMIVGTVLYGKRYSVAEYAAAAMIAGAQWHAFRSRVCAWHATVTLARVSSPRCRWHLPLCLCEELRRGA